MGTTIYLIHNTDVPLLTEMNLMTMKVQYGQQEASKPGKPITVLLPSPKILPLFMTHDGTTDSTDC